MRSSGRERVLVVEDEALIADILCQALSDYLVEVALNGKEAWRKLNEQGYDLLIADVHVPGIHGYELLRMAFEKERSIPALVISGAPLAKEALGLLKDRRCCVLLKPFRLEKVRETVRMLLEPPTEE